MDIRVCVRWNGVIGVLTFLFCLFVLGTKKEGTEQFMNDQFMKSGKTVVVVLWVDQKSFNLFVGSLSLFTPFFSPRNECWRFLVGKLG